MCHLREATSVLKYELNWFRPNKKTLQRPFSTGQVMNNFSIHLINYQDYNE